MKKVKDVELLFTQNIKDIDFYKDKTKKQKNSGITLIALVITIIVLIILAGVVIYLGLENNGILNRAKEARDKYLAAEEKEQKELNDLYSLIKVADNSEITITMEELDKYIENKMQEKHTQTELLQAPIVIPTTTTTSVKNIEVTLEKSIEEYRFLLFTYGTTEKSDNVLLGGAKTMLFPVNQLKSSDSVSSATMFVLETELGGNFSLATVYFKDDSTMCIYQAGASNSGRKYLAITSIQGII